MLGRLRSAAMSGVEASLVEVETDVSGGLPAFNVVGLPDSTVRESRDRVRSAIRHAGFEFPERRITVNLAPADVRKSGASYDLPIALGLLAATGVLPTRLLDDLVVVGALSLDGGVQPVRGVLPVALLAARHGHRLVLPAANVREGRIVRQVTLRPAASLAQIVADLIDGAETAPSAPERPASTPARPALDLVDVRGQRGARRALEIAAAGRHNLLFVGPPGAGKTLLARRLPGILPPPTFEEAVASTAIHSVADCSSRRPACCRNARFGRPTTARRTPRSSAAAATRDPARSVWPTTASCFSTRSWSSTGVPSRRCANPSRRVSSASHDLCARCSFPPAFCWSGR